MYLKKTIRSLYKLLVSKLFIFIYGEVKKQYKLKDSIEIKKIIINNSLYKIFNIKNGSIFTDYVENVAFIKDNQIINEISYQQIKGELKDSSFNSVLKKGRTRFKKKIRGKIFSLVQGASGNSNYFHWIFDILPKLIILEKVMDLKEIDYFYAPEIKQWQLDTLSVFNINKDRLINSNKLRHIQADEIIGCTHPWYNKGYILEEACKIPEWIYYEINKRYINYKNKFNCNSKFYIDRRESKYNHCQIINDVQIKNFLKFNGFSIYKVGSLNFFEQIHLFNNAKIIVGAHGAAFANLIFCKKNTKVIDIIPENHPNTVDIAISKFKELDFHLIKTKQLLEKDPRGDIHLKLEDIKKLI